MGFYEVMLEATAKTPAALRAQTLRHETVGGEVHAES